MARGFESKDVEFQQAEADRAKPSGREQTAEERDRERKKGAIELSLKKARADLASATHPRHREMLDAAIRALEDQLRRT